MCKKGEIVIKNLEKLLFENKDEKYKIFTQKLVPSVDGASVIGVRMPTLRKIYQSEVKEKKRKEFIKDLPHRYYEENLLHVLCINDERDFDKGFENLDAFLPFVDNWAVTDAFKPIFIKENRDRSRERLKDYLRSNHTYTQRFSIVMFLKFYLEEGYDKGQGLWIARATGDDYYLSMAKAWYFSQSLYYHWEDTISILEKGFLDEKTLKMTLQKAKESLKFSREEKERIEEMKKKWT